MKKFFKKISKKILEKNLLSLLLSLISLSLVFIFVFAYITGPDKWLIISKVPSFIRVNTRQSLESIRNLSYLKYINVEHGLPQYNIKIDKDKLESLRNEIPKQSEQLTDEYKNYEDAEFVDGDREYKIKIRKRGVSKNHWLWDKKSWRIQFDDNLFLGIKNLNFIVPFDRSYLVEQFNHYRAKRLGLTVPRSFFSVVRINGKDPAVYWTVEHYEKEMLEVAQLSSDANFYGESDEYTNNTSYGNLFDSLDNFKKYNNDLRFAEGNFAEVELLRYLVNDADEKEFKENIFSIVDKDSFYSWSIHNALAFGQHQDWGHNIRYYFDSSLGKFKFIPIDVVMFSIDDDSSDPMFFEEHSNILINKILAIPEFMSERNYRLWQYVGNENNLKDELEYYDQLYYDTKIAFYQDDIRRGANKDFDKEVAVYRDKIVGNVETMRDLFNDINFSGSVREGDNNFVFNIKTRSLSPLFVEKIKILSNDEETEKQINLEILPDIELIQLPSPKEIYPVINDYYKAFKLNFSQLNIKIDNIDFGYEEDFDVKILIRNKYTDQLFEFNIN